METPPPVRLQDVRVVCFGCVVSYETIFSASVCTELSWNSVLLSSFTLSLLFSPFMASFSHPLLCYSCPILPSAPLFTVAFSFSLLPFSSHLFLSLLISHPLRSPVYLISRLSKGG